MTDLRILGRQSNEIFEPRSPSEIYKWDYPAELCWADDHNAYPRLRDRATQEHASSERSAFECSSAPRKCSRPYLGTQPFRREYAAYDDASHERRSWTWDDHRSRNHKLRTRNDERRTRNHELRARNHEHRTWNHECRTRHGRRWKGNGGWGPLEP